MKFRGGPVGIRWRSKAIIGRSEGQFRESSLVTHKFAFFKISFKMHLPAVRTKFSERMAPAQMWVAVLKKSGRFSRFPTANFSGFISHGVS